jgi:signal transduction histidine kinase
MPQWDLNELIRDWVTSVRELKAFSKITFDLRLERTKGVQVQVDADLLREALFVFLKNAAAAMQESIVRSVSIVTTEGGEGKTRISFTDSGPGIPLEKLERIRADLRAGATEQKERGLGLLTAQLIVTRLGGEMLEPQSSGKGATFTIVLPSASRLE